jgi:hypothetical protein
LGIEEADAEPFHQTGPPAVWVRGVFDQAWPIRAGILAQAYEEGAHWLKRMRQNQPGGQGRDR